MVHEMFGYDYGIKPHVMAISDIEFPNILHKSFEALLYSAELDHYEILAHPPLLGLIFSNELNAKECFSKFKRWAELSNDGDAVGMGFIEFDNGEYGLCIYPESSFLIDRMFSRDIQEEIIPIEFKVGYLKRFPIQSDGFHWFKSAVKSSPFVVVPGTLQSGPIMDMAFRKLHINFFSERDIPENSMERVLLNIANGVVINEHENFVPPNKKEICTRRKQQLDRFFPVTQEVFKRDSYCQAVSMELIQKGFSKWQIVQAACNLVLLYRSPEVFSALETTNQISDSDEKIDILRFLEFLISDFEHLGAKFPSEDFLNRERFLSQIRLDSEFLLNYFVESFDTMQDNDSKAIQSKIVELGLL